MAVLTRALEDRRHVLRERHLRVSTPRAPRAPLRLQGCVRHAMADEPDGRGRMDQALCALRVGVTARRQHRWIVFTGSLPIDLRADPDCTPRGVDVGRGQAES